MTALQLHLCSAAAVSAECGDASVWLDWARSGLPEPPAGEAPDFSVVPAAVRRRLSPMGRCALAAYAALGPADTEPAVWASSWGDIARTFRLTGELAGAGEASPAEFVLSVHNAVGAQAAIWKKNHLPGTAIAAGPVTGSCALTAAYTMLKTSPSVILVRFEEAMPEVWNARHPKDAAPLPVAWAVRITRERSEQSITIKACETPSDEPSGFAVLDEIRFLLGGSEQLTQSDGRRAWRWERP